MESFLLTRITSYNVCYTKLLRFRPINIFAAAIICAAIIPIQANARKYLWDEENQKFIPHIYLEKGSPFPDDFDENQIYYFGGTTIAIEAGLLTKNEIKASLDEMVNRVKQAGAPSIGLTLYPPYPEGFFVNKIMNPEYSYQNA